jgi:hypothetical protein
VCAGCVRRGFSVSSGRHFRIPPSESCYRSIEALLLLNSKIEAMERVPCLHVTTITQTATNATIILYSTKLMYPSSQTRVNR